MDELAVNAIIQELEAQRNMLGTRCTQLAAALAKAIKELNELKASQEANKTPTE